MLFLIQQIYAVFGAGCNSPLAVTCFCRKPATGAFASLIWCDSRANGIVRMEEAVNRRFSAPLCEFLQRGVFVFLLPPRAEKTAN